MNTDWIQEEVRYDSFATKIPSDIIAYEVTYSILQPDGRRILDFGCHSGESTAELDGHGAEAIGVDKFQDCIDRARHKHPDIPFYTVRPEQSLPSAIADVEGAAMTFVHPTIATEDELYHAFSKSVDVMKENAPLALLGLHPDSFGGDYLYYEHRLPDGTVHDDGEPFRNELILPGAEGLTFTDYCWNTDTLCNLLETAGFSNVEALDITPQMHGLQGRVFNNAKHGVEQEYGIERWRDEWDAPLYQIIHGRR